jgi:hypothetical protein
LQQNGARMLHRADGICAITSYIRLLWAKD